MKKRIISLLLVFCMVLSLFPMTALAASADQGTSSNLANPFTDVSETDWFYDAVQYAHVNGFFHGTSKTTFDPDGTIAAFSQQNDTVDLLALGTDLRLASVKGTRIRGEGTSFATAIVTGAAAQLWTRYPDLTADEVRRILLKSTRRVEGWKVFDLEAAFAWTPSDIATTRVRKVTFLYRCFAE